MRLRVGCISRERLLQTCLRGGLVARTTLDQPKVVVRLRSIAGHGDRPRERAPCRADVIAACFEKPEPVPGVRVGRGELDGPVQRLARFVEVALALRDRREVHVGIRMTKSRGDRATVFLARLPQAARAKPEVGQVLHREAVVRLQLQRARELVLG